jgi:hypothetical protein
VFLWRRRRDLRVAVVLAASLVVAACSPPAATRPPTLAEVAHDEGGRVLPADAWSFQRAGAPAPTGRFLSEAYSFGEHYGDPNLQPEVIEATDHFVVLVSLDRCPRGYPPNQTAAGQLWLPLPRRPVEFRRRDVVCPAFPSGQPIP